MSEVVKEPSYARKNGATELFLHVLKLSSSTLHSKAQQVLQLLLDKSLLSTGGQVMEGDVYWHFLVPHISDIHLFCYASFAVDILAFSFSIDFFPLVFIWEIMEVKAKPS